MKTNGIRCNNTLFKKVGTCKQIRYTFVSEDGNTPSACTISLGDIDPMTGEAINDVTFFQDYQREANHEVRLTLKGMRPGRTDAEKAERQRERAEIAREFKAEHGYVPDRDTVRYIQDSRQGNRYHIHLESCRNESGEECWQNLAAFADPTAEAAFPGNEDERVTAIYEVAAGLTGRQKDVFELMMDKYAGQKGGPTGKELAEKWGVNEMTISRDQKKR